MNKRLKNKNKLPVCVASLSKSSQQSWSIPEFYEDIIYNCIDCGKQTIFTAEQQKEWYEEKKRYYFQKPLRCPEHHEIWRKLRKSKLYMDRTLKILNNNPESKRAMKEYAVAVVSYHKISGHGDIKSALHILKKLDIEVELQTYCKIILNSQSNPHSDA